LKETEVGSVSKRVISLVSLLLVVLSILSAVTNAFATSVQMVRVQYPKTVTYGSSNPIIIKVLVEATFTAPNQYGQWGTLGVHLLDLNDDASIAGGDVVATSTPVPCKQGSTFGSPDTYCAALATSSIIDNNFTFTLDDSHIPKSPEWHLRVDSLAFDAAGGYSVATLDFTINVVDLQPSI